MASAIAVELIHAPNTERKRCSDFDWECAHVIDHAACHRGGIVMCGGGAVYEMPPADGDCPYLTNGANP